MTDLASQTPGRYGQTQGRAANQHRYQDGRRVTEYLTDPYHRIRRKVAAGLLREIGTDGHPMLELGCGSRSVIDPSQISVPLVLADLALGALTRARLPVAEGSGVLTVCLDATCALPFRSGSFGTVVMADLIEHVYDPAALLRECRRVLASDGRLLLTTPNLAALQDRVGFLAGKAPRQVDPLHPYLRLHIRPFTPSLLRRLLRHTGFEPSRIHSNFVGWQLPGGRWMTSRLLAQLLPGLGGSLICVARRH